MITCCDINIILYNNNQNVIMQIKLTLIHLAHIINNDCEIAKGYLYKNLDLIMIYNV